MNEQWAAGFFEGEGYAGLKRNKGKSSLALQLSISQAYREPLEAFADIVGEGIISGPYGPYAGTQRKSFYRYTVVGPPAVEVANKIIPLMFAKGEQTIKARDTYLEYLRQNPLARTKAKERVFVQDVD